MADQPEWCAKCEEFDHSCGCGEFFFCETCERDLPGDRATDEDESQCQECYMNREPPEPDYDAGPPESCPVYRQNMRNAGRGHQLGG